jgi:starch synthase
VRILYIAPEIVPFAKTGGLADVAGTLPPAIARFGHEVKVVMPKYAQVEAERWELKVRADFAVRLGSRTIPFTLWAGQLPGSPVEALFLANDCLFDRPGLYQEDGEDYPDNLRRFSAFSRAVLEIPKQLNWYPDVLHVNDWQTALIAAYLKADFAGDAHYKKTGTVFTIHNLAYGGLFPASEFHALGLPPEYFMPNTLEFYNQVSLIKAGLVFAGILNTVSPTHSREIQTPEYGLGLEGVLQARQQDLYGVINGADYQQWDPAHDPHLPKQYNAQDLSGKRICKRALQKFCGFPLKSVPLIGIISRLTPQKGVDLILEALGELMQLDLQIVLLGVGDPDIEQNLEKAARQFPEKLSVHLTFDESLAHRIEAGADIFLMPSKYEPCGLNQLYSLRYGTIPVARKTGGLADTITDAIPSNLASGSATGFLFEPANGHAFLNTVRLALYLYKDRGLWAKMVQAAMAADFSWDRSAREYLKLYEHAVKKTRANQNSLKRGLRA